MKTDFQVGIVEAGFAGIITALNLKKSRRDSFIIFERASEIGGTWRDNIYPGCACDVPSHLYSISSEPNPNWSNLFSSQQEIFSYLKNVVKKNNLDNYIRYDSEIMHFEFLEKEGAWSLTDKNGKTTTVQIVIMAVGPLNRWQIPQLKGLQNFKGKYFHSSQWDTSFDVKGKSVAVVGTGASSIQIIPSIAPDVAGLTVFQRTAAWISPRLDRPFSERQKERFKKYPLIQKSLREFIYWFLEFRGLLFIGNKRVYNWVEKMCLKKLEKEVHDPEIRKKLTPSYKVGCKRILVSDDYLPAFNLPNVHLEISGIKEMKENSIVSNDGKEYFVDAIIFGTGFVASEIHTDAKIIGCNGRNLFDEWLTAGLQAYRGTTVSGYPNLAFVLGPNTGLGHNSVVHMMESQMPYIMQYISHIEKSKSFLNVKPEIQNAYNANLQKQFSGTVWESGCKSWYLNSQGKNTTLYPRLTTRFRKETRKFNIEDYEIANKT